MKTPSAYAPFALPLMMTQLAAASWETIFRRSLMMVQGNCSASEYLRMTAEKTAALNASAAAMLAGRGQAAALAPFVSRARANARRLRRS